MFVYLFIYFWLCWVFVSMRGLSLLAASGGHSSSRCTGLSLSWPLLLRSTSSRHAGLVVVAYGPSCSTACGIFPDQGSNPCPLHWQADSQPLRHRGSRTNSCLHIFSHFSISEMGMHPYNFLLAIWQSWHNCLCLGICLKACRTSVSSMKDHPRDSSGALFKVLLYHQHTRWYWREYYMEKHVHQWLNQKWFEGSESE